MDLTVAEFWLTVLGMACWVVCFWWMHRISARQESVLTELHEQAKRIESLSKAEHELIKEVHPQVGEIKEGVKEMATVVKQSAQKGSL